MASKEILIIAGPNGAGKTTFALTYLWIEAEGLPFLNADMIAAGLAPLRIPPLRHCRWPAHAGGDRQAGR